MQNNIYSYSYDSDGKVIYTTGDNDSALLQLVLVDKNKTAGFYELMVNISSQAINRQGISDKKQAYLAGYAEGEQTAQLISMYYRNVLKDLNQSTDEQGNYVFDPFYINYTKSQLGYINDMIQKVATIQYMGPTDPRYNITEITWWRGIDLIINQWLRGLVDGHNAGDPSFPLNLTELYLLNSQGDMDDLEYFVDQEKQEFRKSIGQFHRCTGSVRLTDNTSELFMSHNTWTSFASGFLRIAKHYIWHIEEFNVFQDLENPELQGTSVQEVKFSSYPGLFFSLDDFYILRNKDAKGDQIAIGVLETTFHTFNTSLYDKYMDRNGRAVLMWTRIQLSNMLATNAEEWNRTFQFNQSWTYNNEYLLLDYRVYDAVQQESTGLTTEQIRQNLSQSKLLARLEVIPGYGAFEWSSKQLVDEGFYVSINVPQNETLYEISGTKNENDEDGTNYWSYNESARLCIAKKLLPQCNSEEAFRNFTRYNDYLNDECQKGDPGQGIASRYDLRTAANTRPPSQFGCTDTKYVTRAQVFNTEFTFLVGQTAGGASNIPRYNFSQAAGVPEGFWSVFPGTWTLADQSNEQGGMNVGVVVASILVPVLIIVIGIIIWTVIFYKKGGYKVRKGKSAQPQEDEGLLQKDGDAASESTKKYADSDSLISAE